MVKPLSRDFFNNIFSIHTNSIIKVKTPHQRQLVQVTKSLVFLKQNLELESYK